MSGVEGVVRQAVRILQSVVRPLHRELWERPSNARGPLWTASLWMRVVAGGYLFFREPLPSLVFAAGWGLVRFKTMRKKSHTRPLPYRRHR